MPDIPLQLNNPLWENTDESIITGGASAFLNDGYFAVNPVTGDRVLARRPGLESHIDLGTGYPVDGLFWWSNKNIMLAISNGRIFKITASNGTVSEYTIGGTGTFVAGVRPTFASDGDIVLIASGGTLVAVDLTNADFITDVDAPSDSTHIVWLDTYYLANDGGLNKFQWSAPVNGYDTWSAIDYAVIQNDSTPIKAMGTDGRELWIFSENTVSAYYDDGVTPWARYDAGVLDTGCIAPYSAIRAAGNWVWLNNRREICVQNGRTVVPISQAFAKVIQGYETVSDAKADSFQIAGQVFYVLSFPTEGKTHVINMTTGEYQGEWSYYRNGVHERWLGNCVAYSDDWNQHLVGSRVDGKIYIMSTAYFDDAGNEMRSLFRTGHVTHGTYRNKRSKQLRIRLKRGVGLNQNQASYLTVRYRDNGSNTYKNDRQLNVGITGDTNFYVTIHQLGIYRSRQYEFQLSYDIPLYLVGIEEDVDKLNV